MSKRTLQRALRAEGYQRRVIRKAIRLRVYQMKETEWLGAGEVASACDF